MSEVHETIRIGEWEITSVDDTPREMDVSSRIALFEGSHLSAEKLSSYFPSDGKVKGSINVFIVRNKDHTILIDTGFGKLLFNTLASLKIQNEDIDIVLITHAHHDHISGLLDGTTPLFPKARVLFSAQEKTAYVGNGSFGGIPDKVAAAYGLRFGTFNFGEEIVPGVKTLDLVGHTEGHAGFEVTGNDGSKIVFIGDLIHATDLQFAHPDECAKYDADKPKAAASRRRLMERAAVEKILIAADHILFPGVGHVEKVTGGEYKFISISL